MENKNTDFINFGTYGAQEADILKRELEKQGIPVKVVYPGTNVGIEATAGAYFTAYKLMIRACDVPIAENVRKRFNIEYIGDGEKMPLPKPYSWAKKGLSKYFLIGLIISWLGISISSYLSDREVVSENTTFYFVGFLLIFIFLWIGVTTYNIFKNK